MLLTLFYNILQFLMGSRISEVNIINISFIIVGLLYGIIYYKFKDIDYFTLYIANMNNVVMFIGADVTIFAISKYIWTRLHASSEISQSSIIDTLHMVELSQDQKNNNTLSTNNTDNNTDNNTVNNIICDENTGLCMRVDNGFDMKKANKLANEITAEIENPSTETVNNSNNEVILVKEEVLSQTPQNDTPQTIPDNIENV